MATIEADVSSHAEAVLHGRLSKLTQDKLNLEQQQRAASHEDVIKDCSPTEVQNLDVDSKKGGRQFVQDLRRKLRKAIR